MLPIVSVVIPSYNHEKYIEETLGSILNQTFQDFEIIITDDGSSDETVNKIKKFNDPRIKLFTFEKNKGACRAVNNCIINSKGKYIAYVSSDDVWELNKLEKQLEYIKENPEIGAVFTKAQIIDEDSNPYEAKNHVYSSIFDQENRSREEWLNHFFFKGNCICHPSILINKDIYDEVGLYNEKMANIPDFEMWVRICLKYDIHIMDEKLIKFRIRAGEANASGDKPETHIRARFEYKQLLNHYLKIDDAQFFSNIFPEAEEYGDIKSEIIPYFLGRLAYKRKISFTKLWGLEVIYDLMKSEEIVRILEKDYDFSFPDFIKMTGRSNVFNMKYTSKINQLRSQIYEMEYFNNKHRSLSQRISSKFPSICILKQDKNLKRSMVNIKGYKAIKKNKLFDIGYYLKNNRDVRFSGKDPLIHYMYHGYKEKRRPSPKFDDQYYVNKYDDAKQSGLNPLIHYSLYGLSEKRKIKRTNNKNKNIKN